MEYGLIGEHLGHSFSREIHAELAGYDYRLQELTPAELEQFGAEDISKLCFYVLCAVKNPVSASTVNLKCPVVVDPRTNEARQVILETDRYGMRHPLSEFKREGRRNADPAT